MNNSKKITSGFENGERGSVVLFALIIILVLTVIGFAAVKMTTVDTYIAGNVKAAKEAFYNAEGGLRSVFSLFEEIRNGVDPGSLISREEGDGLYEADMFPDSVPFWNEDGSSQIGNDNSPDVYIEELGRVSVDVDKSTDDGLMAGNFQLENRYGYHSGSGGDGVSANLGSVYVISSTGTSGGNAEKTITAEVTIVR